MSLRYLWALAASGLLLAVPGKHRLLDGTESHPCILPRVYTDELSDSNNKLFYFQIDRSQMHNPGLELRLDGKNGGIAIDVA